MITDIQTHAELTKNGLNNKCGPGRPIRLSEALISGEGIAQGDLLLIVVDEIPDGFVDVTKSENSVQLVPGNTVGAKHCLDSTDGVTIYRSKDWNIESLEGPVFVTVKEKVVLHPTHGSVTIPAGMIIGCFYDKELDMELKKERRAAD